MKDFSGQELLCDATELKQSWSEVVFSWIYNTIMIKVKITHAHTATLGSLINEMKMLGSPDTSDGYLHLPPNSDQNSDGSSLSAMYATCNFGSLQMSHSIYIQYTTALQCATFHLISELL